MCYIVGKTPNGGPKFNITVPKYPSQEDGYFDGYTEFCRLCTQHSRDGLGLELGLLMDIKKTDNPNPNPYIHQNISLLVMDILGPPFGVLPVS